MEAEIQSIEELDPLKIYHIELKPDASAAYIERLATAGQGLGIKALITRGGVRFEAFLDMFKNLPNESKQKLLDVLNTKTEINPLDHEQTK